MNAQNNQYELMSNSKSIKFIYLGYYMHSTLLIIFYEFKHKIMNKYD